MDITKKIDRIEAKLNALANEVKFLAKEQEVFAKEQLTLKQLQKDTVELINIVHNSQLSGFKAVDDRMAVMDKKINKLAKNANVEFGTVKGKLDDLHSEIKKISKVTGYEEQYNNLLKVVKWRSLPLPCKSWTPRCDSCRDGVFFGGGW